MRASEERVTIEVEVEKGASGVLSISQWIAEQKGLV